MNNNHASRDDSKYMLDDILDEELYDYLCEFEGYKFDDDIENDDIYCKQHDNIYWKSCVEDIDGGDNFIDYCEYIFGILEEEGCYD